MKLEELLDAFASESRWVGHYYARSDTPNWMSAQKEADRIRADILALVTKCVSLPKGE